MKTTKRFEFELVYLSHLTREGIKPLSRWERNFGGAEEEILRAMGLKTHAVERTVLSGATVRELLFSTSEQCLNSYVERFNHKPISRDPESVQAEGLLFGYPKCCVESYLANGYAKNGLRRRDQRILFHWACPQCVITPRLLPQYRRVYHACRAARQGRAWRVIPDLLNSVPAPHLRPSLAAAVSLAALGLMPAVVLPAAASAADPHVCAFTLYDDGDADFLTSNEEIILGFNPALTDQNKDGLADGVDLALRLTQAVNALPTVPSTTKAFVTHHEAFGLEDCTVCGEAINMGFLEVIHPLENQAVQIPYIAKHFLEHGSFSYSGSLHSGRINPPLLNFILTTDGRGHLIAEPAGTDADQDGLRAWEEAAFGADPQKTDTDSDLLPDGVDTARALLQAVEALPVVGWPEDGPKDRPFLVQHWANGVETCPRCGEVETMGYWEVINPVSGDSITLPTMGIHYLRHGAFGWKGGQLLGGEGRIDPRQLQAVLTGKPNLHLLAVTMDQDGDFLADPEEVSLGKDPAQPDEDWNRVLDGLDLARVVVCEIAGLPTAPSSNQVYRVETLMRGLEQCQTCGTNVNMGYLTIYNPQAHLSVEVPYIALHYLEHDSFSFAGSVHGAGRIDIRALLDVLFRPAVNVAAQGQQATLRWMTRVGRSYQVFTAPDPLGLWTGGPIFQGDGTEKVFTEDKQPGDTKRFFKVVVR